MASPDIGVLKRLAEVDQEIWLKAYGDGNPYASLRRYELKGKDKVDGNDAWIYYGEIETHSDVGFSGKGYEDAYGIARQMRFKSDLKTDRKLFVPDPKLWKGR